MSSSRSMSLMRHVSFLWVAVLVTAASANAQSSPSPNSSSTSLFMAGESSSNEFHLAADGSPGGAEALSSPAVLSANPSGGWPAGGAGQEKHGWKHIASHGMAFDFGAGFNAPIGNDTSSAEGGPFITYGGNFTAGAGLRFSQRISLLGEFQFIDDKLPGSFIAEAGAGATNGNAHMFSLTAAPVVDLFPKRTSSIYLTGGGGFYHKSTNFTVDSCCDFYGDPISVNTNSFTSNQLGGNLGLGVTRRLGGINGDGQMKLFAEARYLFIDTPRVGTTNGLGRTELIPVTFGVRW
ncbi:MAG: hypothetical protein ABSD44_02960 [Terracidiphilus sp.]